MKALGPSLRRTSMELQEEKACHSDGIFGSDGNMAGLKINNTYEISKAHLWCVFEATFLLFHTALHLLGAATHVQGKSPQ